jgi:predicted transcriptional regulator
METFKNEMGLHETLLFLKEKEQSVLEISDLLEIPGEQIALYIETLKKRNLWEGEPHEVL